MNGHENGLLQEISKKIDKLDDTIKDTNEKIATTGKDIASTQADVRNLIGWSQQMEHKLELLQNGGCTNGQVLRERINNINSAQDKQISEIKSELGKKATKAEATKISSSVGAATGTVLSALVQILTTFFK